MLHDRDVILACTARISEFHDPLGRTVSYRYNPEGRLARVTDAEDDITRYTYDN